LRKQARLRVARWQRFAFELTSSRARKTALAQFEALEILGFSDAVAAFNLILRA
jgi:hypothetical protein